MRHPRAGADLDYPQPLDEAAPPSRPSSSSTLSRACTSVRRQARTHAQTRISVEFRERVCRSLLGRLPTTRVTSDLSPPSLTLSLSISPYLSVLLRVFRDPAGCSNASGGVRAAVAVVSRGETRHNAEPRERRVATVTSKRPEESRHRAALARYSRSFPRARSAWRCIIKSRTSTL